MFCRLYKSKLAAEPLHSEWSVWLLMLCRSLPPGCPGLLSSDLLARRGSLYVESILLYEQVKKLVMTDACALYGVLTDSTEYARRPGA